jgi:hypothetical protein
LPLRRPAPGAVSRIGLGIYLQVVPVHCSPPWALRREAAASARECPASTRSAGLITSISGSPAVSPFIYS